MEQITEITLYSDGSSIPNPGPSGYGIYGTDNLKNTYSGYGPVEINGTNNMAELTGVIKAIEFVFTIPTITTALIKSDSRYVVDNIKMLSKWCKNNWATSTGSPVANLTYWKTIQNLLAELNSKGIKIKFEWVKGHSNSRENIIADSNATKGRLALISGITDHVIEQITDTESDAAVINNTDIKKKKKRGEKVEKPSLPPLLSGKRWFFNTSQSNILPDGRYVYTTTTYLDSKKTKNKNLGKRNADTHYSLYLSKDAVTELEGIKKQFNTAYPIEIKPILVELPQVTKGAVWPTIINNGFDDITLTNGNGITKDGTIIGYILHPPKLVYNLESIFNFGMLLLQDYENGIESDILNYIDVTNYFLDKETVKKRTLVSTFTQGEKILEIKDIYLKNGKKISIKLNIGIDIPLRSTFLNLLKLTPEFIKITMIVFAQTEHSMRIALVIETSNSTTITFSNDANYRLI